MAGNAVGYAISSLPSSLCGMVAHSTAARYWAGVRASMTPRRLRRRQDARRTDAGALAGVALIVARVMGKWVGVDTAIRCSRMAARRTGSVSVANLED
jgi:hypothetical protein